MATNKVLTYEIEIKGTEREAQKLNEVEVELARVRKERKAYLDLMKEGVKLDAQNSKALAKLTAQEKQLTQEKNKLNKAVNNTVKSNRAAVGSYDSLTSANARLTARLRQLEDPLGKNIKTYRTITAAVKKNEDQLKQMDAAMGRHQRNVGNYGEAIKGAFSQFGLMGGQLGQVASVVQNLGGAMKASVTGVTGLAKAMQILKAALISTGIGALVVAVGSLITYFRSSSEAALKFKNAVAPLAALVGNLAEILQTTGKVLFNAFSDIGNFWTHASDGVKELRGQISSLGEDTRREAALMRTLHTQRHLNAQLEIKDIEQLSDLEARIAEARDKARDSENYGLSARKAAMQEAFELNKQIHTIEQDAAARSIAALNLELIQAREDNQVKLDLEKQMAEAQAAYRQADRDFFTEQRGMRRDMMRIDKEAVAATKAAAEELIRLKEENDELLLARNEANKIHSVTAIEYAAKAEQMITRTTAEEAYKREQIRKVETMQQIEAWGMVAGAAANLAKEGTAAYRVLASTEALISTYAAINKTLKEPTLPFPSNVVMSAVIGATGLANVAKINGLQFASGGRIPSGYELPHSTPQGDNTLIIGKPGEVVLNQNQQAALGGDNTFRRIGVPGFANGGVIPNVDTGVMAANALRNSVESIKVEVVEREIRGKATYAKVLEKLNRF